MSKINRAKTAKGRAAIAIKVIKTNQPFDRYFDSCFEMGGSNEVMNRIIESARTDKALALALLERIPTLGDEDANRKMHAAIQECLQGRNDLFSYMEE